MQQLLSGEVLVGLSPLLEAAVHVLLATSSHKGPLVTVAYHAEVVLLADLARVVKYPPVQLSYLHQN